LEVLEEARDREVKEKDMAGIYLCGSFMSIQLLLRRLLGILM